MSGSPRKCIHSKVRNSELVRVSPLTQSTRIDVFDYLWCYWQTNANTSHQIIPGTQNWSRHHFLSLLLYFQEACPTECYPRLLQTYPTLYFFVRVADKTPIRRTFLQFSFREPGYTTNYFNINKNDEAADSQFHDIYIRYRYPVFMV